ncbi:MAG TPA: tetratricopeptide repeat protein [Candidatus Sulfotelmatobacter sp.]|nr:tetratricopeptide repeat protein [Candidatus Sulfotelmatobacter sp.]
MNPSGTHASSPSIPSLLRSPVFLSLILFAGVLILYVPALDSSFVNYDDPAYVTSNSHVLQGLSWSNVAWAFRATTEANWHPLTWLSHMADVQLFGLNPRGHHLTSVLLHGCNVVLLFFVLRRATGCLIPSAVVAGLFALHPLNVECVAWVAERKSVLSMFFLLVALVAYGWYARQKSIGRYALVVALFALGLAAKPMVVTVPVLLLLWDYWPLRRIGSESEGSFEHSMPLLVVEKVPLFALAVASSWVTLHAQRSGGALGMAESLPLASRLENAIYSYAAYVGKGIWPSRLAVFYPHPENSLGAWKVLAAAIVVVSITVAAWRYRAQHRYLLTGWLWYLAALVPMIGIVQVGRQAMADRYAYLPFVGLFIIAVWGCAELFASLQVAAVVQITIAAAVVVSYASVAFFQINYWHNSYKLFAHALQVTHRNGIAEDNFGAALMEMGRPDLAQPHFEAAAEFIPQLSTAHYNLAVLEQQQSHPDAARREYELALKYSTDATEIAQSHSNLGFLLLELNDLQGAIEQFDGALQINSGKQNSLLGRGIAEYRQGNLNAAVADLSHASQIAPLAQADFWLGRALEDKGQTEAARTAYETAVRLAPGMAEAGQRLNALRARH